MSEYLIGITVNKKDEKNRIFLSPEIADFTGYPEEKSVICMENDGYFSIYSKSYLSSLTLSELEQKAPLMEDVKLDNQRRMLIKPHFLVDVEKNDKSVIIFGRGNHVDVVFRSNLEKYLNNSKNKELKNSRYLKESIKEIEKSKVKLITK